MAPCTAIPSSNVLTGFLRVLLCQVSAAIFQGEQQIGDTRRTRVVQPCEAPEWQENLAFDIRLADLPRDAKLCIAVHGVWINPMKMKKKKKKFRNEEPLVWINVSLFTFRGLLRSGLQTFSTWAFTEDNDDKLFLPHGTTMQNVHGVSRPSILKVDFGQYVSLHAFLFAYGNIRCLSRETCFCSRHPQSSNGISTTPR
jgi:phosphatidylinositol-4,5-bisphosphate 3-kinase